MKIISSLLVALVMSAGLMAWIHTIQTDESASYQAQIDQLWQRTDLLSGAERSLENHRLVSKDFRKLSEVQRAQAKSQVQKTILSATSRLESMAATDVERTTAEKLNQQINDFLVLSARLEPMLFLRDVYLKDEAREAHDQMISTIGTLRESAEQRLQKVKAESETARTRWSQGIYLVGVVIAALSVLLLLTILATYVRPLQKLVRRVREIRVGQLKRDKKGALGGVHGQVESCLDELAFFADTQKRERHQFVTAVVTDLRNPLTPIQTGASLLATQGDKLSAGQRGETADLVRRSVLRLSRTLDDLSDTLQMEGGSIRLDEKVVDLRETAEGVARLLGGPGAMHQIRVFNPKLPVWTMIDSRRLERVLVNLISKLMQYTPHGGAIEVVVNQHHAFGGGEKKRDLPGGSSVGAEILVYPVASSEGLAGSEDSPTRVRASGPEQDVLKHWASENGFSIALAQKIMQAHGGMITAAGVAGASVIFSAKLPQDRLAGPSTYGTPGVKTFLGEAGTGAARPEAFAPNLNS